MPECADCEAAAYSVKGTGVNAERGMAHGSSTFEESRSLGSSVDGIGETLRAERCNRLCLGLQLRSMRPPSSAYLLLQWCLMTHRWTTMVAGRLPRGGAALGGVADQGEGAALAPRGTACSETPSSGEDPVTGFVSNRAIRTQLKCLPARGCGTR